MRSSLTVVPLLSLALLLSACVGRASDSGSPRVSAAAVPARFPASGVLHGWDHAGARAFAAGDVGMLGTLYVDGSAAGMSDVRMLRDYLRRGMRVEGMRMQVLALEVAHEDAQRLRVLVTDRVTGAVAVGRTSRFPLPQDQASTRVVELRRTGTGAPWKVAFVRASSRRPAAR